ncbi:MAG: branched-chain amino acid ABC transporter permease [Proteobacteria bacterium]|nr:MAG: branched-chain amino acid ABC transporter permease [Pseudomonadota bacterium]
MNLLQNNTVRAVLAFGVMAALLYAVGVGQSWTVAVTILNMCLISAIMAMGVNIQWGYAGLFNVGVMGFAAVGGLAAVLVAHDPVKEAWSVGGLNMLLAFLSLLLTFAIARWVHHKIKGKHLRHLALIIVVVLGFGLIRLSYEPAVQAIEAVNPVRSGFLGGLGLPILFSWIVGGLFAAGAAWLIGKVALGLRADYLAIATLGISEIIISVLRNEDWLARGVKNVTGLPRPVPYEIDLQQADWFIHGVARLHADQLQGLTGAARAEVLQPLIIDSASLFVKLAYAGLFSVVLILILILCVLALNSPWGRMIRAIRDNEVAASAMGKGVKQRHLQIFVLGSAVIGIAGAMLVTLDGQFTPGSYSPLRFTFLIWVMVIVGGSGNNLGAVLGGFLIWFVWVEAEPAGFWLMDKLTAGMDAANALRTHLLDSAQYMRVLVMGIVLLLVMRFSPRGILPEQVRRS